jgi:pyoverdine/dityrosine biosynthesis protein Dit1
MTMEWKKEGEDVARRVLRELLACRRQFPRTDASIADEEHLVAATQLPRLRHFIERNARIDFILPAFPTKSPNPRKVLGHLPDMAEKIALQFLERLCQHIKSLYAPGARIVICADGHVFADLIRVRDNIVESYQQAMKRHVDTTHDGCLELVNLTDLDTVAFDSHDRLRQRLVDEHAEPLGLIKTRLMNNEQDLLLYRSITRFLFEDGLLPDYNGSRTALQRDARQRAVGVIQRSWAWGNLLAQCFPDAIRLSIHPQPAASLKIGIHMLPTRDDWLTPWHGVATRVNGRFVLMKRSEAERMGGRLMKVDGAPSHYVIDDGSVP